MESSASVSMLNEDTAELNTDHLEAAENNNVDLERNTAALQRYGSRDFKSLIKPIEKSRGQPLTCQLTDFLASY